MRNIEILNERLFGQSGIVFVMDNRVFAVEKWLINANAVCEDAPPPDFVPLADVSQGHNWDYAKLTEDRIELTFTGLKKRKRSESVLTLTRRPAGS